VKPNIQVSTSIYKQKPEYIFQCVDSVIHQSYPGFILTIRSDGIGSIDPATHDFLRDLSQTDKRVRYEYGETRKGIYSSYNHLFGKTRLPFILQLDADDFLHPFALEVLHDALISNPNAVLAFSSSVEVSDTSKPLRIRKPSSSFQSELSLLLDFFCFHPRLIRRDAYAAVGRYNQIYNFAADYDLCLKLNEAGSFEYVDLPLYNYRLHEANASLLNIEKINAESCDAVNSAIYRRGLASLYNVRLDPSTGGITLEPKRNDLNDQKPFYIAPHELHSPSR